jgi:hypothetical protein
MDRGWCRCQLAIVLVQPVGEPAERAIMASFTDESFCGELATLATDMNGIDGPTLGMWKKKDKGGLPQLQSWGHSESRYFCFLLESLFRTNL